MAGAKGYSSYRGRGSKWKILLAILLVAVIAVAASVIYLEQFMVYSADGRRQIVLPWQTEGEEPSLADGQGDSEVQPEVDLVVQEPESTAPETFTAGPGPDDGGLAGGAGRKARRAGGRGGPAEDLRRNGVL